MKKPKKPLAQIADDERIVGVGGDRHMLNPKLYPRIVERALKKEEERKKRNAANAKK